MASLHDVPRDDRDELRVALTLGNGYEGIAISRR